MAKPHLDPSPDALGDPEEVFEGQALDAREPVSLGARAVGVEILVCAWVVDELLPRFVRVEGGVFAAQEQGVEQATELAVSTSRIEESTRSSRHVAAGWMPSTGHRCRICAVPTK